MVRRLLQLAPVHRRRQRVELLGRRPSRVVERVDEPLELFRVILEIELPAGFLLERLRGVAEVRAAAVRDESDEDFNEAGDVGTCRLGFPRRA